MFTLLEKIAVEINPDDVTPGVIGFAFTAIIAAVIITIGLDLNRRIRRVKYRQQIQEEIDRELSAEDPGQRK